MTKLFCDLCGKPADPPTRSGSVYRTVNKAVDIVVRFRVEFQRTGCVGPTSDTPDVCLACVASMLRDLADMTHSSAPPLSDELKEQG